MKRITGSACLAAAALAVVVHGGDPLASWTTSSLPPPSISSASGPVPAGLSYANGRFFAGRVYYDLNGAVIGGDLLISTDGLTWRLSPTNGLTSSDVVYGNGLFVAPAGGLPATFQRSVDGQSWTVVKTGLTNATPGPIAFGNGLFVSIGAAPNQWTGAFLTSPDGLHWTLHPSTITNTPVYGFNGGFTNAAVLEFIAYGNGIFYAFSPPNAAYPSGASAISRDGITWTQVGGAGYANAIAYGNGQFVIVGGEQLAPGHSDAFIASTTDGIDGALRFDSTNGFPFTFVGFGGGQFVVGGTPGQPSGFIFTSADATNWRERVLPAGLSSVTFGNGRFVGIGGGTVLRSGVFVQLGASLSPGGALEGTIAGVPGQVYSVQSSSDLAVWTSLTNVTVNTNGVAQFTDPDTSKVSHRFYAAGPPSP